MKTLWTAKVEMMTPPEESGNTKCFTNVFAWASDPEDFAATISRHLEQEGVSLIAIEASHAVASNEVFPEETQHFIDWVREHPGEFTTADRHYYPSRPS
jgi:hypothetical protein